MTAAIFGLLGVIVGGVLSGVITWRIELSRERRDARAGARLVYDEIAAARAGFVTYAIRLDAGAQQERAIEELVPSLRDDAWRAHRDVLARALDREWQAVSSAYYEITFFRSPGDPVAEEMRKVLLSSYAVTAGALHYRDKMDAALIALARYSGDPLPQFLEQPREAAS